MAKDFDLLAELQAQRQAPGAAPVVSPSPAHVVAPPAPIEQADTPRPRVRRAQTGTYERVIGTLALLIALAMVAGVWYVGAQFTIAALASWGQPVAQWGLAAWLIPIAISILEAGTMTLRTRAPALWLLWGVVLAIDVFTTAAGILDQFAGIGALGVTLQHADPSSWVIAGLIGLGFALAPEPLARQVIRELLK